MFERRNIQRTYLKISREVKDFLLSDKSREFFIFLFFFFVAGGFWLLQTLNNDYEADFSIPVRLKGCLLYTSWLPMNSWMRIRML